MNKRKRSYDKYPQWLKASAIQTGANATTTTQIVLPIDPMSQGSVRTVVEILKVKYQLFNIGSLAPQAAAVSINIGLTTNKSGVNHSGSTVGSFDLADPNVFSAVSWNWGTAATAVGQFQDFGDKTDDITDGYGAGQIIATPNIYVTINSGNVGTVGVRLAILYRFATANLQEWIGILQSQQSGN